MNYFSWYMRILINLIEVVVGDNGLRNCLAKLSSKSSIHFMEHFAKIWLRVLSSVFFVAFFLRRLETYFSLPSSFK